MTHDLVVVGSGPGGSEAALRAAASGLRVALVERSAVGGTCLHRGCIPSKALITSAAFLRYVRAAPEFGVEVPPPVVNFGRMAARRDAVVSGLAADLEHSLRRHRIQLIAGDATLERGDGPHRVHVRTADGGERLLLAGSVVFATGSEPAVPQALEWDGRIVVTSDEALRWTEVPSRVLVVGGGVIGCEFAGLLLAVGAEVTIVEALPTILATEDSSVARQMTALLRRAGATVYPGTEVAAVAKRGDGLTAMLSGGECVAADRMLVCVGRRRNSDGLAKAGLPLTGDRVLVNDRMETSVPGVYSVGDVANEVMLAHWASAQGAVAAANAAGGAERFDGSVVPACLYTYPEVGRVGLKEEQARDAGHDVCVGRAPFGGNARARCAGETAGFVKVVADRGSGRLLGVHILGPNATELVHEAALALRAGIPAQEWARAVRGHPTYAETLGQAALLASSGVRTASKNRPVPSSSL
jgi:dihydrolipoamide dehydrogenase